MDPLMVGGKEKREILSKFIAGCSSFCFGEAWVFVFVPQRRDFSRGSYQRFFMGGTDTPGWDGPIY